MLKDLTIKVYSTHFLYILFFNVKILNYSHVQTFLCDLVYTELT